jgi:hypothetical protein
MDKQIALHKKFVQAELARLEERPDSAAAGRLLNYHQIMTRNFQHERAIHLAVTLFFAGLMLLVWALMAVWLYVWSPLIDGSNDGAQLVSLAIVILSILITVWEAFYIRYYFLLENRIQKLYSLNRAIFQLTDIGGPNL